MRTYRTHLVRSAGSALLPVLLLVTFACDDATGPDGSILVEEFVFGAVSPEPAGTGMFRVGLDGSGLERIAGLLPQALDVAPDGTRAAIAAYDPESEPGRRDIYVVGLDGGDAVRMTNDVYFDDAPAWSPDGSLIAYITTRPGEYGDARVFVMNADGSDDRLLVASDDEWITSFEWSSRFDRVALSSQSFGGDGRVLVGFLDEPRNRLRSARRVEDERARALAWSPDGMELVGVGPVDPNGNRGVVRMIPDGSTGLSLTPTETGGFCSCVSYSRDGTRIVYGLNGRIRIMDADGRNNVEVPLPEEMFVTSVDWRYTPAGP